MECAVKFFFFYGARSSFPQSVSSPFLCAPTSTAAQFLHSQATPLICKHTNAKYVAKNKKPHHQAVSSPLFRGKGGRGNISRPLWSPSFILPCSVPFLNPFPSLFPFVTLIAKYENWSAEKEEVEKYTYVRGHRKEREIEPRLLFVPGRGEAMTTEATARSPPPLNTFSTISPSTVVGGEVERVVFLPLPPSVS